MVCFVVKHTQHVTPLLCFDRAPLCVFLKSSLRCASAPERSLANTLRVDGWVVWCSVDVCVCCGMSTVRWRVWLGRHISNMMKLVSGGELNNDINLSGTKIGKACLICSLAVRKQTVKVFMVCCCVQHDHTMTLLILIYVLIIFGVLRVAGTTQIPFLVTLSRNPVAGSCRESPGVAGSHWSPPETPAPPQSPNSLESHRVTPCHRRSPEVTRKPESSRSLQSLGSLGLFVSPESRAWVGHWTHRTRPVRD